MIIGKGLRQKLKRLSTNKNYRHRYCRSLSLKNVNIALHIFLLVYTKNSEENHKTSQETVSSVQDIVFDQSQLIIVQAKDELWCHAGQIAQIIQHSVEEVTAVLRQNKVRVINGAIFALRHLRTILTELDVEADIISEITSQL